MSTYISEALEGDREDEFVLGLLFVRHVANEPEVTSHPFTSYKNWFEQNFANESTRLVLSTNDVRIFPIFKLSTDICLI